MITPGDRDLGLQAIEAAFTESVKRLTAAQLEALTVASSDAERDAAWGRFRSGLVHSFDVLAGSRRLIGSLSSSADLD